MQEALKKVVLVLAVLGLLGFVINLVVDNPYTHRLVRAAINEKVKQNTNLTLDFKAMKVSVVPPGVDLYGFFLATDVKPHDPLVTASHVRARLSLWSLILGDPRLSLAETDDLTFIWPPPYGFKGFLKDQTIGPPEPEPQETLTWPPPFELPVDRIILKNTKVYAEIPLEHELPKAPSNFVAALVGVDLDLDYGGWTDLRAKLGIRSVNAAIGASSMFEETSLDTVIVFAKDQLALPTLRIRGERLNFDGALTGELKTTGMKLLDQVILNASGTLDGDLSLLGSFLDLPSTRGPVEGTVQIDAKIPVLATFPAELVISGNGKVKDAYLNGFRLHNSAAKFRITPELVEFPELDIIFGEESVGKASGAIKVGDAIDFDFRAVPDGLRLLDLLDSLSVSFELVDATIQAPDLRIWGLSEPFAVNVSATGQFTGFDLPTIPMDRTRFPEPPACRLDFHLLVNDLGVDFGGTHGNCFQPPKGTLPPMPAPGQTSAPGNATATAKIAARGGVSFDEEKGLDLDVRGEDFELGVAEFFAQVPLAGVATTQTRIHGKTTPGSTVLIESEARVEDLVANGVPLGEGHGFATVDGLELRWHDAEFDLDGEGKLSSKKGKLGIADDYPIVMQVSARQVKPAAMQRIMRGALGPQTPHPFFFGIDKADAELAGPLFFPGAWRGRLDFGVYEAQWEGARMFDAARGLVKADARGISTEGVTVSLGPLTAGVKLGHRHAFPFAFEEARSSTNAWAKAGLHPDDDFDLEVTTIVPAGSKGAGASGKDQLASLPFVGAKLKTAAIEGAIQLDARLKGSPSELEGTVSGALLRPQVLGSPMTPLEFKGFVKNGAVDLVFNHSGGAFEGRMSLDVMKPNIPYEWYFNFNRMDLRAFGTEVFHKDPRNFLYLTAGWHMKGALLDWWRSVGELEIKDIRAKYVSDIAAQTKVLQVRQEQPVTLRFTGREWRFDEDKDLYLAGRHTQLRVSMPDNRPPEKLGIRIESIMDIGLVKEFSQEIDTASGKVRILGDIHGPVSDPKLRIELSDLKQNPFIAATWTPVTFGLADLRPAFRNVRFKIVYEDQRLTIESLEAEKGTGTLAASGELDFRKDAAPEDSRLDVELNDANVIFPVAFLKSFEAQLSGNLALSGSAPPFKLAGDVRINRARSMKEVDIRNEIINALRSQSFKTVLKSEKPTIQFDMTVRADQTINIHNRNLQLLLSSDLAIKGTDNAPSVTGQVEVAKGKFIYKRDFVVQRGFITFDDPVKPDPSIDLLAVSEVDNYRVYIVATGRASNPTIEFSVDPPTRADGGPISKVEILVLLSRGKLPEEERSVGQATQSAATSEALNLIMGQFEEPVEKLFDLSGQNVVRNVYIDTHPSTNDGSPVPRLNLPLDLGEDFDVVVRSDQSTDEVSTEYNVHENIRFSGTYERTRVGDEKTQTADKTPAGPVGDAKLNLKFRFSFD